MEVVGRNARFQVLGKGRSTEAANLKPTLFGGVKRKMFSASPALTIRYSHLAPPSMKSNRRAVIPHEHERRSATPREPIGVYREDVELLA